MGVLKRTAVLLLIVQAGCEFGREPVGIDAAGGEVAAYSILLAGSDTASVLLVRYHEEIRPFEPSFDPIPGAEVSLVHENEVIRLNAEAVVPARCFAPGGAGEREVDTAPGCYMGVVPGGIRPGEMYRLVVILPTGKEIVGQTVIPRRPELLRPEEGALIPIRRERPAVLRVAYTAPPEAGLLTLAIPAQREGCEIRTDRTDIEPGSAFPVPRPGTDSVFVPITGASCFVEGQRILGDTIAARLVLTAYDEPYARFSAAVTDRASARESRISAGLTGAFGVFSGAASDERRLFFVP